MPARAALDTPLGVLTLSASPRGLVSIDFPRPPGAEPSAPHPAASDPDADHPAALAILARACEQLERYFKGELTSFDVPLDPPATPFQRRVWDRLMTIPFGTTTTYLAIARALGDTNATRAVGLANGSNPIPIIVPCHRVIGSDGSLTGYAGGLDVKRWLLDHERRIAPATGELPLFAAQV